MTETTEICTECRGTGHIPEPRPCAHCGTPFTWKDGNIPKRARIDARYCSSACQNRATSKRYDAKRRAQWRKLREQGLV